MVDQRGTRKVATEYLSYLYSDEAQRIAGDNYYRPYNKEILKEYSDVFDLNINLVTINDFGGWDEAQKSTLQTAVSSIRFTRKNKTN